MNGFPEPQGHLVRHFRKAAGLSQEKLAALAGVNVMTVRRIETGSSATSHLTTMLVAQALQVEPANFYDLDHLQVFLAGRQDSIPEAVLDVSERAAEPVVLDESLFERLRLLPKAHAGARFGFGFENSEYWERAEATETESLCLETGDCIKAAPMLKSLEGNELEHFGVYASAEIALALLDLNPLVEVEAKGRFVYGVIPDAFRNSPNSHPSEPREFEHVMGFALDGICLAQGQG